MAGKDLSKTMFKKNNYSGQFKSSLNDIVVTVKTIINEFGGKLLDDFNKIHVHHVEETIYAQHYMANGLLVQFKSNVYVKFLFITNNKTAKKISAIGIVSKTGFDTQLNITNVFHAIQSYSVAT